MKARTSDSIVSVGETIRSNVCGSFRMINLAIFIYCIFSQGSIVQAGIKEYPKPIFQLTQGQGIDVCTAYFNRLNVTEFVNNTPAEGRLNEPLLEGFADLKTTPLSAEEIQKLYFKIISFELFQDQQLIEKHKNSPNFVIPEQALSKRVKKFMEENQQTPFVKFVEKIDLDNDGIATDTVIKNKDSIYIVDSSLRNIDEERMKIILGDQEILQWPTIIRFPPRVLPLNLFAYRGKYYFDGFQNLVVGSEPAMVFIEQPMYLKVFIYEKHQAKQVCEYEWLNVSKRSFIRRVFFAP